MPFLKLIFSDKNKAPLIHDTSNSLPIDNRKKEMSTKLWYSMIGHLAMHWQVTNAFLASVGWLEGFMKGNGLSLSQKTHQSQRLPSEILPKVLKFPTVSIVSPQK